MKKIFLVFLLTTAVTACSPVGVAKALLPGKGIGVNANTQAGKTNTQTLGSTNLNEQKAERINTKNFEQSTGDKKVQAESVETVNVNEKDSPWLIITLALVFGVGVFGWIHGWLIPSPKEKKLKKHINDLENKLYGTDSAKKSFL